MGQLLGNVAVGSIVKLKENGSPQNYIVVHQGLPSSLYDASCNGTWLLRQNIIENKAWDATGSNVYILASIFNYLSSITIKMYDSDIQSAIKTVKIPHCVGGGSSQVYSGANGDSCKLFLLGGCEVGYTTSYESVLPVDGAKLSYFKLGSAGESLRSANSPWWLRSPYILTNNSALFIEKSGSLNITFAQQTEGVRPAMVMPTNLLVDDSNNIVLFPTIAKLTAPSIAMQQQSIPLSWTPVSVSGFDVTYQLQRNVNNGGWQNVGSSISQTSYTDTAQSGWTEVQYQVAPVIDDIIGNYTQSSIIPVSDSSVLVISGSDGNLGTLTSNVPYTVSSNTGNQISLTRTVNGAQVVTLTVDSGFAYNIPIADLPTGTGTIQITASVKNGSETVTKTRTWTYYKTPINIPSTGGIAQLTQNGQNIWPVTVPDAVEAPVYLGGNLNAALNKLGQAALYTKIGSPKYNQVTVDLSKVKVGDEVLLPENGTMVPFYVGSLNYEPTLNTNGNRVLLIRKNVYQNGQWNSVASSVVAFPDSDINTWLNTTYYNILDSDVKDNISETYFYYTQSSSGFPVATTSNKVFLLSVTELGGENNYARVEGEKLEISDKLGIVYLNNNKSTQWTRTPQWNSAGSAFYYSTSGVLSQNGILNTSKGIRPCFTLPTTFNQTYYVDSSNNIHPSQEYTQGGSITDVFGYDVPIAQTEIGTYVGTGTSGQSSPNTLTFSFEPKVVFISTKINSTNNTGIFIYDTNAIFFPTSYPTGGSYLATTWQGNQISWYYANASVQLNVSGRTYNYIAIG